MIELFPAKFGIASFACRFDLRETLDKGTEVRRHSSKTIADMIAFEYIHSFTANNPISTSNVCHGGSTTAKLTLSAATTEYFAQDSKTKSLFAMSYLIPISSLGACKTIPGRMKPALTTTIWYLIMFKNDDCLVGNSLMDGAGNKNGEERKTT
nr:hypothetical protein Iba_chr12aCG12770 [Ipomoea batatas]